MDMLPSVLPDKLPGERVQVVLQLANAIGAAVINIAPTFISDPAGLIFTSPSLLDANRTAVALCEGGTAGTTYIVSALCTLSTGEIVQPVVALPVISPERETIHSRSVVL